MTAHPHPPGASKSGFDLVDTKKLFSTLPVNPGETVLDAGCGEGRYTLPLASRVGSDGLVYAADLWEEGLAVLQEKARESGFANIRVLKADVSHPLPLAWASLDLIFLATVLHDPAEAGQAEGALSEIARLLKPGGRLAVVEFKKVAGPPGPPPPAVRLAPEAVAALVRPYGFVSVEVTELGPRTYLVVFTRA